MSLWASFFREILWRLKRLLEPSLALGYRSIFLSTERPWEGREGWGEGGPLSPTSSSLLRVAFTSFLPRHTSPTRRWGEMWVVHTVTFPLWSITGLFCNTPGNTLQSPTCPQGTCQGMWLSCALCMTSSEIFFFLSRWYRLNLTVSLQNKFKIPDLWKNSYPT